MSILEQMLQSQQFIPSTAEEYFALQLARRLRDDAAVKRYLHYVEHHSPRHLLYIFHRVKASPEPASSFHSLLTPHEP